MTDNSKGVNQRNIYISNIAIDEAKEKYYEKLSLQYATEMIPVREAIFRTTVKPIFANISSPHYPCSAMDGIAVVASDTYGASEIKPKLLEENISFEYINTGQPLPKDKDSVIMIEDVDERECGKLQIIKSAYPWQHVRAVGEDIVQGEMILSSNHYIRALDMGALISAGIKDLEVYIKPKVGILPTGNEIVRDFDDLEYGKILDSNSGVFDGLIQELGGTPNLYKPVKDIRESLKEAIKNAVAENDILIINAGSSAGSKDYTADIIRELGEVVIHGVALKPGKPTILGIIEGKPVIGVPGYPVSAYFSFEVFVKPLIESYVHNKKRSNIIKAKLSQRVVSSFKHEELVRVTIGEVNGKKIATPLNRGAGTTMSLVKADGVLTIPRMLEGVESGEEVDLRLVKSIDDIFNRLVFIGSHDLIIDIIADELPISSGHVGSMGGIMSMRREEAHISPIHLLDEKTGEYNMPIAKKYFAGKDMAIIKGVRRLQGIIVQNDNPKNIQSISDLTNESIVYVNRQRGAGTRQLFDYELKRLNIINKNIIGYEREMTTHTSVAVTVKSGAADAGLGIYSAAKAMDLDFVAIGYEEYDFLISANLLEDERVQNFIKILKSEEFKEKLEEIGGYVFKNPGEILKV